MTVFFHQLLYNWTHYNKFWSGLAEVLSPDHIAGELFFTLVFDLIGGILLWPRIQKMIRKHDKEHHDHECDS